LAASARHETGTPVQIILATEKRLVQSSYQHAERTAFCQKGVAYPRGARWAFDPPFLLAEIAPGQDRHLSINTKSISSGRKQSDDLVEVSLFSKTRN
jgi:hypothetical protein